MLRFRPHTIDREIFSAICFGNEYQLPPAFEAEDVILDIGVHAGYFAHCALQKGAGRVVSVEAERENYELARSNLQSFIEQGRSELIFGAIWRSDAHDDVLYHGGHTLFPNGNIINTGGGDVLWTKTGLAIPTMAFDELLLRVTSNGEKTLRLLKLDCEGSEWPILLTSKHLHLVREISGEYHEIGGDHDDLEAPFPWPGHQQFTETLLRDFLESEGFEVVTFRHVDLATKKKERVGMFFARRLNEG